MKPPPGQPSTLNVVESAPAAREIAPGGRCVSVSLSPRHSAAWATSVVSDSCATGWTNLAKLSALSSRWSEDGPTVCDDSLQSLR